MRKIVLMTMATLATASASAQGIQYPKADKDGTVDNYFGTQVADPYRWLEDDTSAKTAAWVEAENKVTNDYLSKIPFRQQLLRRLTEVSNYEKIGAPTKTAWQMVFLQERRTTEPVCDVCHGQTG